MGLSEMYMCEILFKLYLKQSKNIHGYQFCETKDSLLLEKV